MASSQFTLFDGYEEEFKKLIGGVEGLLEDVTGPLQELSDEREENYKTMERRVSQASQLVQQMEVESRSKSGDNKKQLLSRAKEFKNQLKDLRQSIKKSKEEESKRKLFGHHSIEMTDVDHERLRSADAILQGTSDNIGRAIQCVAETEEIAIGITEELSRNRATIQSAHSKVRQTSALTGRAHDILASMGHREKRQKMAMCAFIALLLVAILYLLFSRIF